MANAIRTSFTVPAPVDRAWAILTDFRHIAPCIPGAELTEIIDEGAYQGRIGVRLGPVALSFVGTVRFEELDAAGHRAVIKAIGTETRGRGAAQAAVLCTLAGEGENTRVDIETNLDLSGAVAQYGRASGMIAGVARQMTDQFAAALAAEMQAAAGAGGVRPARVDVPLFRLVWQALVTAIGQWVRRLAKRASD